jgi:hypothetical protein
MPARPGRSKAPFSNRGSIHRLKRWDPMDSHTKHELWLFAVVTISFEVPFIAVAALAWVGH